ncbi:MAG: tetratricopeptide repeat protein [Rhodothermales bacterium]
MRHINGSCALAIAALALFLTVAGCAQEPEENLYPLGKVYFETSCSDEARPAFNRAVALLHHMTYPQAREAFQHVAETDPQCAMAHWGIAMTLFQPTWPTRPGLEERQRGWEAVQKAKALEPPTEHERLFIAAAEAFFSDPTSSDYWQRIRRWEQGMEELYVAFPQDPEAATFYALAHLATARADTISRAHADRAAEILLAVHERNPDHPGAMHYMVHANDMPSRKSESLEIVGKYESVAPRNPHALHMPTHIYTRLGDWEGVIRGNLRAAEAALEHPAGDRGEFVSDEYPHAIEYLVYAYLQTGADEEAVAWLKRLAETAPLQPTFKTAFHLASTQARYALERQAWDEAALLVPREPSTLDWDRFMWPEAVARFAVGLGEAHQGRVDEARRAVERLEELETATSTAGEDLFARNIRILRLEVTAWIAHVEQDVASSQALMRQAADLEVSTPKHAVTPGATLPAHELLGDLLMEQEQPEEALSAYEHALDLYPRRFNSLLGAARAARALEDEQTASQFYGALMDLGDGESNRAGLEEARTYLSR